MSEAPTCHCGRSAEYHVEMDDHSRQLMCAEHRFVVREDEHPVREHCGDAEAAWLADGCYILTGMELALAAVVQAAAESGDVPGIWQLDPESEYYGITGIVIRDAATLARLLAAMLPTGTALPNPRAETSADRDEP